MSIIKEAAKEYAENSNVTQENFCLYDVIDAFEVGADYIMSLPLCDRLTSEEKERLKKRVDDLTKRITVCEKIGLYEIQVLCSGMKDMIFEIFGTAMFEEKGGGE